MTGAWAGAGYGWRGSWLVAGRASLWGALAGLGSAAPAPRFLGTQPPCATQALNGINKVLSLLNERGDPPFLFPNLSSYNTNNL